jgi:hypothetical protein
MLIWIRDLLHPLSGNRDGKFEFGIRYKHPGSATLVGCYPRPKLTTAESGLVETSKDLTMEKVYISHVRLQIWTFLYIFGR